MLTKRLKSSTVTKYAVHYNSWDGEVRSISSEVDEDSRHPYVWTNMPEAGKIVNGTLDPKGFIVSFPSSDSTELQFMAKDNVLRLRSSELALYQLPNKKIADWDMRVNIYATNNKMEIEVNPNAIKKLTSFTYRKTLEISEDSDLTLYIIKRNNPDYLIDTVEVDPVELLTNGNIVYDISHITKYTSYDDIGFITRRCFKNYYCEIFNSSLIATQKTLTKHRTNAIVKAECDVVGQIELELYEDAIQATAKIPSNEFANLDLYEEWLVLYSVGATPDEYYGTIGINLHELQRTGKYRVHTDVDIEGKNLIYNKPKLILTTRVMTENE